MKKNWKTTFTLPFCNSLLCAEWDGSLYFFNEKTRGEGHILRKAKYNDLPMQCISTNENMQIAIGTWDGKILFYDSLESTIPAADSPVISYLPMHLLLLSPGSAIAGDQAGCVHFLDCQGAQKVIWKSKNRIKDMWAYEEKPRDVVLLVLENKRVVEIKIRENQTKEIELSGELTTLSHRKGISQDKWTALVMKGGIIDWLSWKPLGIVNTNRVKLNFEILQFIALYDPMQPAVLLGIGLTEKGEFFTLNGKETKIYPSPRIEKILVSNDGRFVFWLFKGSMEWLRNPVVHSIPCKVEKISQEGELVHDLYKEIRLAFKNTGITPIYKIKTQLKGQNRVMEEAAEEKDIELYPGQTIELSFSVKATAVGTLNLELYIEMEDEAGPPVWKQSIGIKVESKEK